MSCRKVEDVIGPDWRRSLELARRCRPCSSFFVPVVAWTRRVLDMVSNWMRGERIGMIVRDGGIVVECPCNQFFISLERVIRSSSVLLSWRWVAMVMFAFFLVPMVLGFGVLVMVWALEFVGAAMVIVGS